MQNIPNDPQAIMEAAIANEIEGHKILQRGKKTVDSPLARATFEFLANEELKHIELIKDFSQVIAGIKKWDPESLQETTLSDAGNGIRGIFEQFAHQYEEVSIADDERLQIYQVAMDMERRGYDFYTKAADKVQDERAKKLLQFLASEEIRHFQIIQDTHSFLQQPDAILAMEERWMQT
ncbi:MAG TPA: ferritin family protein [Armatimonadota bacterium]|jgi:rubrerythrin|nr:ferritin family protein [Armatimonadota bacterium]HOM71552.1 ferritin family protein [Armatimonadota bacterium]